MMCRLEQGDSYGILSQLLRKKPQFEIDLRRFYQDKEKMKEIIEKLVTICRKCNMIFSEESSRAIYEMGNMELIELKQTSATIQCLSCLKHVPKGLNMCPCGVWLRPNHSTMDRIRAAFAALKTLHYRSIVILSRGMKERTQPMADGSSQSHGCRKSSTETRQIHF